MTAPAKILADEAGLRPVAQGVAHLLKLEARGYMLPERDTVRLREFRRQLRADALQVALSGRDGLRAA